MEIQLHCNSGLDFRFGLVFRDYGLPLVAQLVRNLPAMREILGSVPGLGRSPGGGNGYPLQYSGLENCMDSIVHEVAKSWTRLRDFHSRQLMVFVREGHRPAWRPVNKMLQT